MCSSYWPVLVSFGSFERTWCSFEAWTRQTAHTATSSAYCYHRSSFRSGVGCLASQTHASLTTCYCCNLDWLKILTCELSHSSDLVLDAMAAYSTTSSLSLDIQLVVSHCVAFFDKTGWLLAGPWLIIDCAFVASLRDVTTFVDDFSTAIAIVG